MRAAVAIALVGVGCGRIGFDSAGSATSIDAPVPFVEAIGVLDDTFGGSGYTVTNTSPGSITPYAVLRRSNGYLSVGVHAMGAINRFALIGLTSSGQPDATFGTAGRIDVGPTMNDFAYGAARIDANRILLAGDGDAAGGALDDFTLGIIDDSGTPSPSFGTGGFARIDVRGLMREDTANRAIVVDGTNLIACGNTGYDLPDAKAALVRLDLAGNRVASFGTNGDVVDDYAQNGFDECSDIVEHGANVLVAGEGDGTLFVVAAYRKATGARDTAFGTNGVFSIMGNSTAARSVTIVDGDIVAGGKRNNGGLVVRLAPDGTRRTTFGTNGEVALSAVDSVLDVVAQPNNKILVCGSRNGNAVIVRLKPDGTLDTAFGTNGVFELDTGGNLEMRAMSLDPDGKIVFVAIMDSSGVTARVR